MNAKFRHYPFGFGYFDRMEEDKVPKENLSIPSAEEIRQEDVRRMEERDRRRRMEIELLNETFWEQERFIRKLKQEIMEEKAKIEAEKRKFEEENKMVQAHYRIILTTKLVLLFIDAFIKKKALGNEESEGGNDQE